MKIPFLHGLESSAGCDRVLWLESQGHEVYNPQLEYITDNSCYENVSNQLSEFKPNLIGCPVRWEGHSKVYMALGTKDTVVDPETTMEWMCENDPLDFNPNNTYWGDYGHRTSLEHFKKVYNKIKI